MVARKNFLTFIGGNVTYIFFILLFIVSSIASPAFMTPLNLANLIRQYSPYTLLAVGLLVVIITGGIDLSVGSIVSLTNCVLGLMMVEHGWSEWAAMLLALLIGLTCGAISGYLVSYRRMAPFIVTLAMMSIARSLAYVLTNAQVVNYSSFAPFIKKIGADSFLKIGSVEFPYQLLILIVVVGLVLLILRKTSYGRLIYAIGSNENAVILSGVNNKVIKFSVYCISGLLAALSAILTISRITVCAPSLGSGYELDAIAGCVIGGASLAGGKGSALKTVVGVFVLAMIGNIMNLLAIPSYPQDTIKGIIILLAVLFQD